MKSSRRLPVVRQRASRARRCAISVQPSATQSRGSAATPSVTASESVEERSSRNIVVFHGLSFILLDQNAQPIRVYRDRPFMRLTFERARIFRAASNTDDSLLKDGDTVLRNRAPA